MGVFVVGTKDYSSDSFRSSKAFLTAAMTNAEKVQEVPRMAFSTSSTTSLGKRTVLLVVGDAEGILNLLIVSSQYNLYYKYYISKKMKSMHCICNAYVV